MNIPAINLPPHLNRAALLGLPTLGLVAAVAIAMPRYQDLRARSDELTQTKREVLAKQTTLAQLKNMPLGPTVARLPLTREEPVQFLHDLNALAARCQVRILTYTAAAPATPNPASLTGSSKATPTPTPGEAGLPPGTTPAPLTITAEGTYSAIALFFGRLETYSRLLSVSQVTMNAEPADYPLLRTQFQLTRYIGAEEPALPAPTASGAAATPEPSPTPAK